MAGNIASALVLATVIAVNHGFSVVSVKEKLQNALLVMAKTEKCGFGRSVVLVTLLVRLFSRKQCETPVNCSSATLSARNTIRVWQKCLW